MDEKELREMLREFEVGGMSASCAHWSIELSGFNLIDFELYKDGVVAVRCIAGELENVSLSEDDFNRIGGVIKDEYPDVNFDKDISQDKEMELRAILSEFDEYGKSASGAHWSIRRGGFELNFELYRDGEAVVQCIAGKLENVSLSEDEFYRIGSIINGEYPDAQLPNMTNNDLYKFVEIINPNNELGWTLAQSDGEGIVPGTLIVEKVDEMNVFEDDYEASLAAAQKGVPFIMEVGIEDFLYVDTVENKKLVFETQKEDVVVAVDWRGFTEQDFENLRTTESYDPKYDYNSDFYAGDLLLSVGHAEHTDKLINIDIYVMKDGGKPGATPMEMLGDGLEYKIEDLRNMRYPEFQEAVMLHLKHLVADKKILPEKKAILIEAMDKPSPTSWAYVNYEQQLHLAKALLREGETLANIEKEYISPNKRQNLLLHGGTKKLMKKLTKDLEKDKEIKKILSNTGR